MMQKCAKASLTEGKVIGYLRGVLIEKTPDTLILDVSGVGYEVTVPASSFCVIGKVSEVASLYIYTHVREDSLRLFGFASLFDRKVFQILLTVSSVGPKLALSLLGPINGVELCETITSGHLSVLVSIPGVGQKTAERLLLELRTKAQTLLARRSDYLTASERTLEVDTTPETSETILAKANTSASKHNYGLFEDLEAALTNLGYKDKQISEARKICEQKIKAGESLTIEAALRIVLRKLSGHLAS